MLRNAVPVPLHGRETHSGWFSLQRSDTGDERAYVAYETLGTLYAIVSQIAYAVSTTAWHLYRRTPRRPEVYSHGFLDVWNRPNDFYTGQKLRETVQKHLDLTGEGAIVFTKAGNTIYEMWPVRPDRIVPIKHPQRFITGYMYVSPHGGEEVPLKLDQVLLMQNVNPRDPYHGLSAVNTVLNDIDAARFAAEWNRNFFINGASPGGVIQVDYRMNDAEFNSFLARWRQQHQGVANAHRVAVLENAEWKDTNFSMEDMQFVELRNLPREIVREAFAFPKPMLGTVEDVNRANAEAGKEIMAQGQTVPRLNLWRDTVNTFLLPQFANGDKLELDFDDPTPVNREAADRERNSKSTSLATLVKAGFHPNDVTDALEMPRMRWIGIPASSATKSTEEMTDEDMATALMG